MDEGRVVELLLELKEDFGEVKSELRSLNKNFSEHVQEDDELVDRVSVIEKSQYRLSVLKGLAISAFGVGWTVITWYAATAAIALGK